MLKVKNSGLSYSVWLVATLVGNIAEIYEMFFDGTRDERLCHGWFLKYIHEEVNNSISQFKYDTKKVVTANNDEIYPPYKWDDLYEYLSDELANNAKDKKASALTELMKKPFFNDEVGGPVQTPMTLFLQTIASSCRIDGTVVSREYYFNDNGDEDDDFEHTFDAPKHCEVIMIHRKEENRVNWYHDAIVVNGHTFRARYISYQDCDDINELKAVAFVRHREIDYDMWWCLERNSLQGRRYQEPYAGEWFAFANPEAHMNKDIGLPDEALTSWEVMIFVRTKDKMQEIVNESFKALGGHLNVICEEHRTPLVDSKNSSKEQCSYDVKCTRHSHFECPWTCTARICKHHLDLQLKEIQVGHQVLVPPVGIRHTADNIKKENIPSQSEERNEDKEDDAEGEASASDDDNSIFDPYLFTSNKILEIPDDASYSDMFLTDPLTEIPSHMPVDEDLFDREEITIPTAGATVPRCTGRVYARNGKKINAHIIYNMKGQCLLRTNNKLAMSKYEKGMLQGLLSTTNDPTPLSYPEGIMFPDIFFMSNSDGSIVGSLTGTLWTDKKKAATVNIASYHDHLLSRISNTSVGTSCNSRYIFQGYDVLSNVNLRGCDDRTILNRGLRQRNPGLCISNQGNVRNNVHSCDVIDSRHSVNCLSSQLRDGFPSYFITMTCNNKEFPSMRRLHEIKNACILKMKDDINFDENIKKDLEMGIEASMAVQNTRTWQVCMERMLKYLTESSDEISGKFKGHFGRLEHQESEMKASGTNSHMHLIAFIDYNIDSEDEKDELYQRVRCSSDRLFFQEDIKKMIEMGIIMDEEEAELLRKNSRILQVHDCARCKNRCKRKLLNGDLVCRYTDYAKENPDKVYGFILIHMKHSKEATAILIELDFLQKGPDGEIVYLDKRFEAGKHVYPADRGERFSPTNPILFGITRSDCNVIVCGRYMVSRYLAKYVASIDEVRFYFVRLFTIGRINSRADSILMTPSKRTIYMKQVARVDIRSRPGSHGDLEIKVENLQNTKIGSSKIAAERELQKKRQRNKPHSRIIGLPEVVDMIFEHQSVFCSRQFTYVSTVSLESRPAVMTGKLNIGSLLNTPRRRNDRHHRIDPIAGTATIHTVAPAIRGRRMFETSPQTKWRQFTKSQQLQIADNLDVNLSMDSVTRYSIRPPELMFVNSYVDFTVCFAHTKLKNLNKTDLQRLERQMAHNSDGDNLSAFYLAKDVIESFWINGFEEHIKIRPPGLDMVLDKYSDRLRQMDARMLLFFHALYYLSHNNSYSVTADTLVPTDRRRVKAIITLVEGNVGNFVDQGYKDKYLPLPLLSSVKSSNASKFFVHILLSMGTFDTEYELWNVSTVKEAFENASLLRPNATDVELAEDMKHICHRYISEQLLFVPAGTKQFDFYVCEAQKVISSIYTTGTIPPYEIPTCLHAALQAETDTHIMNFKSDTKLNMIRALRQQIPYLPTEQEFLACNRTECMSKEKIAYKSLPHQSEKSKEEQQRTFEM